MVDYAFYKESYMGELAEGEYNRLLPRAKKLFDNATYNRASDENWHDDFSYCICELIDQLKTDADNGNGDIASMSDGVTSVTFFTGQQAQTQKTSRTAQILANWLVGHEDMTYSGTGRRYNA